MVVLLLSTANSLSAQVIQFQNPSFEGTPGPHIAPPGWTICQPGNTPDTQPGSWGISLPASDGNTYVGLVDQASSNWHEGISQALTTPMTAGVAYAFSIDLATTDTTGGGIEPGCSELQLWGNMGGNTGCDMTSQCQLLWSSGNVTSLTWQTHNVSFTPTHNWSNVLFTIHNLGCTDMPYIMLDNIAYAHTVVIANHNLAICSNPATIYAGPGWDSYLWSNGATIQSTSVTSSGEYYVTATYNSHDTIDSVHVTLTHPYLNLDIGNDTTICNAATIPLDAGTGFNHYLWSTGSTNQSITVQQTGNYNVFTTDTANCNYYDTIHIVINPAHSLNLGHDTAFCDYHPYMLDAGSAFDSYNWSTGATTQTISVNTTGTYFVSATNNYCSVSAYDTIHLTFHNLPLANAGYDDTICYGSSTSLQASGGTSYHWNSSPYLSCTTCSNPIASPLATTIYTVTVTNSTGCTSSDHVTVNVVYGYFNQTLSNCGNNDGTMGIVPMGGSGSYSYLWSTTPPQTTQNLVNLHAGIYTVTVTDNVLHCSFVRSDTLLNNAAPTAAITHSTPANCGMNNGAISISITGGTAPFTYHWNSVPSQNTPNLTNVPVGYYCLTVGDAHGCIAIVCDSVTATPYAAPEICMVTADTASNHCLIVWEKPVTTGIDKYYIYRESSVLGVYNLIATQNYGNLSTFIDTTSNPLQQSYRYELAIHDNCGLSSSQGSYHQSIHLAISAGMSGAWNLSWNDYLGFIFSTYNIYRGTNNSNMTLINSVASNVTSYSDLTPPSGVIYYLVEAVRPTACYPTAKDYLSTISNMAYANGSGIDEFNIDQIMQVFPNPGTGIFTLSFSYPAFKYAGIQILNSLGQKVYDAIQTKPSESLDISGFSKGIYFMEIKVDEKIYYKKLMLQ